VTKVCGHSLPREPLFCTPLSPSATLSCAPQARNQAAAEQQEQLRQLPGDEALRSSNQQLQEQLAELQDQLWAATALQRATQVGVG
jgi:hypothetical protein